MEEKSTENVLKDGEVKQIFYFAHYINVESKSPQHVREILTEYYKMLEHRQTTDSAKSPYDEKHFVLPIKNGDSKVELLYPQPLITESNVSALYEKYMERMEAVVESINRL